MPDDGKSGPACSLRTTQSCEQLRSLAQRIAERRAILFVGAGVSMNVGLPSWRKLTEHMVDELSPDRSLITRPDLSYQTIAEYYRLSQGSIVSLSRWLDREWNVCRDRIAASAIHEMIVSLEFPIIYTTNYDRNLETAFELHGRPYIKVTNAHDVARASGEVTQIIKFHGDFDEPESLVLAESDHFDRLSFDSPLDVKFRSDALGLTVLFIGYSMSDMNIRLLLYRLWRTWSNSGFEKERPPSFIFMPCPNPVQEAVLGHWGISMLSGDDDDPGMALQGFLELLLHEVNIARRRRKDHVKPE
jgi:hypothetical protein